MLPKACYSARDALERFPRGMQCETKYDGSRIQIHKTGDIIKCFSRKLYPIPNNKLGPLIQDIQNSFSKDIIVDGELLIYSTSGKLLTFSALGKSSNVASCVIFDCLSIEGKSLLDTPLVERFKILHQNYIPNDSIKIIESNFINSVKQLEEKVNEALEKAMEGVVLKDPEDVYRPGERGWLKIKNRLVDSTMRESLDLIVMGTWKPANKPPVFLMGCYDEKAEEFVTVVHVEVATPPNIGKMIPWEETPENLHTLHIPEFIAKDFKKQPVWEITGAGLINFTRHTAGVSILNPRFVRAREDKSWKEATPLSAISEMFVSTP